MPQYDAVIVGSGPNGLAAAIEMARAGCSVLVIEAKPTIGGGARTMELTLPGYLHDVCSAIHPLGIGSPFFKNIPMEEYGVEWIQPDVSLAHPLDDGTAGVMVKSLDETANHLGEDGARYRWLMRPYVERWDDLAHDLLGPLRIPRHLMLVARFGIPALLPARLLAEKLFQTPQARAMFAGIAAHGFVPLEYSPTASFGLILGAMGHVAGWVYPRGGSQTMVNALAAYLRDLGGEIITDTSITDYNELPSHRVALFNLTPYQILKIARDHLPQNYRRTLGNFRYGPGVFKIDWALDGPIPWTAEAPRRAGTVHVGGTLAEVADSEGMLWHGKVSERPLVLVAQQSLQDPTRAPEGKHTGWAYCHVPRHYNGDMTTHIEAQIERFAPGFRDLILARHTMNALQMESYNNNYIGGDINGGLQDLWQLFTRPSWRLRPYATPNPKIFICSSATPPGGGVHGLCGYYAAQTALQRL